MHLFFWKNIGLHPAAIRTRIARKVDEHGFARGLCFGQSGLVIIAPCQLGFAAPDFRNFAIAAIRREKCVPFAQGRAQKARHQIQPKGQTTTARQQAQGANRVQRGIVGQADFAEQIHAAQQKDGDPARDEKLARQNAPLPHEIDIAQKFQCGGQFQKAHHHLHGIEPTAALGQCGKRLRKECQKEKRRGKRGRKREHAQNRPRPCALCGEHQQRADKGRGTRK